MSRREIKAGAAIRAAARQAAREDRRIRRVTPGVYSGPFLLDRNAQIQGVCEGGQEYGFGVSTVTAFGQVGLLIPLQIGRRVVVNGLRLACVSPPGEGRASFDIKIAPNGTAIDGGWHSILDPDRDKPTVTGTSGALDPSKDWGWLTDTSFWTALDVTTAHPTELVHIPAGWDIGLWLIKADEGDGDTAYGDLANFTLTLRLRVIE